MIRRLDFGCAFDQHEGWVGVDRIDYGFNVVADILDGLPFPDQHFEMVVCNHSLQMITFHDLPRALAELRRVLKVGGVLRILVPDADKAIVKYVEGTDDFPVSPELETTLDGRFLRFLFWHGDARSAFTSLSLQHTLAKAGFLAPHRVDFGETSGVYPEIVELDSREAESVICEATR